MMVKRIIEEVKWILGLFYGMATLSVILIFIGVFTVIPWGLGIAEMWRMLFG